MKKQQQQQKTTMRVAPPKLIRTRDYQPMLRTGDLSSASASSGEAVVECPDNGPFREEDWCEQASGDCLARERRVITSPGTRRRCVFCQRRLTLVSSESPVIICPTTKDIRRNKGVNGRFRTCSLHCCKSFMSWKRYVCDSFALPTLTHMAIRAGCDVRDLMVFPCVDYAGRFANEQPARPPPILKAPLGVHDDGYVRLSVVWEPTTPEYRQWFIDYRADKVESESQCVNCGCWFDWKPFHTPLVAGEKNCVDFCLPSCAKRFMLDTSFVVASLASHHLTKSCKEAGLPYYVVAAPPPEVQARICGVGGLTAKQYATAAEKGIRISLLHQPIVEPPVKPKISTTVASVVSSASSSSSSSSSSSALSSSSHTEAATSAASTTPSDLSSFFPYVPNV